MSPIITSKSQLPPLGIMGIKRKFFKVGQALFSVERVDKVTIVYDCGGENKKRVENSIQGEFNKGDVIDALFISHYDSDHINGVKELVNRCEVKKAFLPLLDHFNELVLFSNYKPTGGRRKFYDKPEEFIKRGKSEKCEIHYIDYEDEETNNREHNPQDSPNRHPSGENLSSILIDDKDFAKRWVYIPYNRATMNQEQWNKFIQEIELPKKFKKSAKGILDYWKENNLSKYKRRNIIKQAAINTGIFSNGGINDYSMTLYSGPVDHLGLECPCACKIDCLCGSVSRPYCPEFLLQGYGCLYTGDYNAKKNSKELKNKYSKYWDMIGVVQIPHHGSDNNFNKGLIINRAIHVISNGNTKTRRGAVDSAPVTGKIFENGKVVATTILGDVSIDMDCYWWMY